MAPEVYRGEKADVRADIYAFGIVLYQMAKGTPGLPYDVAFNSDIHAYLKKVYSFQMAHRFPRLPHRYWPIIERCLNPDPSQRYSDFSALQHQVKELSGRSFIARSKQSTEAPQDSDVLVNKAASLDSLGKTEEAQKLLDHVIQIDPGNWRAHNNLGLIFKRKDQLEKAIACFQMAFELSKEATPCHGLAVTFWLKGDVDHALEWFDRGLKLAPDRVEFIADRGAMLSQHGRVEDADRAYVHAMNLAPRDPRIIIGRAQHYARTHRWNDAISLLDENAGALTTNLKFVSMAAQLRSEWQKSEGRGKITPGTEQEAPRVGSSKPYTEQEYREWRKLMGIDDAPEATVIAYRDPTFQGLLGQLVDDIKMCKVVLGLPNGPDLVREVCKLTDEQLRVVCAIAFMAYAPELVKETKSGIPMSERYQGILGARELDPLVLWECIRQILHSYEEQQQNRVRFIAIPEQLARDLKAKNLLRSVIFHETEDQRTVMLHSKKDQQAIMIGLLGAVYGFDEPQIDYIISHDVGLWNFPIAKDRPDIWRQFVQALCCHALDRLPELKARTSWVTVS
jgi:Flp pilus assembly protein TadD